MANAPGLLPHRTTTSVPARPPIATARSGADVCPSFATTTADGLSEGLAVGTVLVIGAPKLAPGPPSRTVTSPAVVEFATTRSRSVSPLMRAAEIATGYGPAAKLCGSPNAP